MDIEWHFFHGFLGEKKDWDPIVESLWHHGMIFNVHDLVEDFYQLEDGKSMGDWAEYKQNNLGSKKKLKRYGVGYSLGGRLLSHLDGQSFDGFFLLGAHPGIFGGRKERLQQDLSWVQKARESSQQDWLEQWNQQEVFANDQVRPMREMSEVRFRSWLDILSLWSLAEQEPRDRWLKENRDKVLWGYGERDQKFSQLRSRMVECLGENQIFQVPQSGHGVLFDNPTGLANTLLEIVNAR